MLQYKPIHRVLFSLLLAVVLMFNGIGASAYFPSSSGSGSGSVGSSDAPYILDTTFVEEQPPYQKPVTYLRIDITKNSAAADLLSRMTLFCMSAFMIRKGFCYGWIQ